MVEESVRETWVLFIVRIFQCSKLVCFFCMRVYVCVSARCLPIGKVIQVLSTRSIPKQSTTHSNMYNRKSFVKYSELVVHTQYEWMNEWMRERIFLGASDVILFESNRSGFPWLMYLLALSRRLSARCTESSIFWWVQWEEFGRRLCSFSDVNGVNGWNDVPEETTSRATESAREWKKANFLCGVRERNLNCFSQVQTHSPFRSILFVWPAVFRKWFYRTFILSRRVSLSLTRSLTRLLLYELFLLFSLLIFKKI